MSVIANPVHSLAFGAITLADDGAWPPDANGVKYVVRPTDTSWGNPSPVTVAVLSLLRQGSLVAYDHTDNRDITLRVTVVADDGDRLALGERALQLECEKVNTLTWTPPDGVGQPSVFDIIWSQMQLDFDDTDELNLQRTYRITMQALPYARTASLITTAAVTPGVAVETVLQDGTSATGWVNEAVASPEGPVVPQPTTSAGSVVCNSYPYLLGGMYSTNGVHMGYNATVNLTGQAYISWTVSFSAPPYFPVHATVKVSGVGTLLSLAMTSTSGGFTTYYWRLPTGLTTTTQVEFGAQWAIGDSNVYVTSVDKVSLWNRLPDLGTARQKALSLVPGGSVKTQGSLLITHASSALGKAIVFTHPTSTGYLPPLRSWLKSSASVTIDTTLVSGARNPIGATTTIYEIPVTNLPQGRAEVWAILRDTTTTGNRTVDWAIASYMGSTLVDYDLRATTVNIAATNTWYLVNLGAAIMPPSQLGTAGKVQVHLHTASSTCEVDEAYIFATDQGRLTIVDCGTASPAAGGSSNRLWVEAPTAAQPNGGVYRGFAADGSDRFHAGLSATVWEIHEFDPTGMNLFVVTPNATDSAASLTYYRRYQTHVANGV
jgi:hypothetical protein